MDVKLKPLDEQVMVVTGADSGIGLATARAAVARGAKVVIASRNADELRRVAREIRADGGQVAWVACDVADEDAVEELATTAVRQFGRIDTWVNNAGVSIYGETERIPVEEARRLFETNYWGTVNGSLAALPHLKESGGALINVGSTVSDRAVPLQGHYSASKHAVKGFTEALRMELEREGSPVAVTLVKPAGMDTPFTEHARNHMDDADPSLPPPVYAPEVAADAILHAAEHPHRTVAVGGGSRMITALGALAPRLADRYMETRLFDQQKRPPGSGRRHDALFEPPARSGRVHGDHEGHVMRSSAYTKASLNPGRTALALAAVGVGVALAARRGLFGNGRTDHHPPLM